MESEDGQFSQRCHFLITYTSIRVRQDVRFDKSANINIFVAIITDYNGRIFISMVIVLQRKVVKKISKKLLEFHLVLEQFTLFGKKCGNSTLHFCAFSQAAEPLTASKEQFIQTIKKPLRHIALLVRANNYSSHSSKLRGN